MRPAREAGETDITPRGRRRDDVEGWHEIVRRFAPYVHAVCVAHGLDEETAAPVFEEVFTRVWAEIDRLADDETLRDRVTELTQEVAGARSPASVPSGTLGDLRQALNLHEAIRGLPTSQREVLQRAVIDGEDQATIADALDLGPDAVAEQLQVAHMRLRGRLRRRGVNVQEELSKRHERA